MAVPTLISDLSTTASSNAPAGSDAPSTLDDIQRAHASFIAQLQAEKLAAAGVTAFAATVLDDANAAAARTTLGAAASGANSDITSLTNLTGGALVTGAALLGYSAGSGGTVTQATSKSTAVTLNKPTGQITMNAAALAAGATVVFIVNNSLVTSADVIAHNQVWSADPSNYETKVVAFGAGTFRVFLKNISVGSLAEAVVIGFAIIKGATA